ncbi:hypothetical protein VCR3J2_310222 [Vibrio coralliirubri]|nr:hypothetical protein VCR3J2_310222 [Vibrio coralliirubri]
MENSRLKFLDAGTSEQLGNSRASSVFQFTRVTLVKVLEAEVRLCAKRQP